jgi:anti-sigma factor RsiW
VKNLPDDLHVLTGSYALDALSESEREEFERHLQTCPACDAEVRGLRETAARLAMARAVAPPARMERRVLAATYQTRQLPPLARHRAARERRSQVEKLFGRRDSRLSGRASGRPPGRFSRAPLDSWPRRMAVAAAAASVAAAAVLGVAQVSTQHQLDSVRASGAAIARVVTASDAHVETARSRQGGSMTVVVSARLREAVVSATGMGALPSGRVYQVWVMGPSGAPFSARSVGLLQDTQLLAHAVTPGDRIGITVERAGGTKQPTTSPVAVLPA